VPDKVFRNSTLLAIVFVGLSVFAADTVLPDGAGWGERWIAYTSTSAPYLIMGMIVWATGVIVAQMRQGKDSPAATTPSEDSAGEAM
jgi:hypothetical protein